MPSLAVEANGIKMPNPFVIGSGPPGTNAKVIAKALDEGWGAVVAKTISLDASKVVNVAPRYARLRTASNEIVGWQNIELISDRPFDVWIDEFKRLKQSHPDGVIIASVMEEHSKDRWCEMIERTQETGVAGFELNFSCPHGLPERKMGAAMGQDPEVMEEVCQWVASVAKIPVWAKLTPNVTHIDDFAKVALRGGADGVSAINTILCVMGVDLDTLRPEPTVEGYTTPGGYSCVAVRPIALRMVKDCAGVIKDFYPGRTISAIGGVESGTDAAQFILLGADTVQVCTGVMKAGYGMVKQMCSDLEAFMAKHSFDTVAEFKGISLPYFTTHADLVTRQREAKAAAKAAFKSKDVVTKDGEWEGDQFVKQSEALVAN